jgi:hypothetical protein
MKAVLTVKMKAGFLLIEREIFDLKAEEVCAGTVVGDDGYSYRDKVGRVAADILAPPKEAPGD